MARIIVKECPACGARIEEEQVPFTHGWTSNEKRLFTEPMTCPECGEPLDEVE